MLMVGIHMALRATELCGLTVGDVYDEKGGRTYVSIRGETAKFNKSRKVRVSSAVRAAMQDFITWKGGNGEPLQPASPLFISERGDHLSRKMLFVIVKNALIHAGINESPHCLRKTGATIYYIESDYDLIATQQFLGHSDPSTTRQYIGLTSEQLAEYSERSGNRLLKAMRDGQIETLDTFREMSNRPKKDDVQQLHDQLKHSYQIIDRLTRLLAQQEEAAPPFEKAVNSEKVVSIDIARRKRQ
jgi:hypothetical protein